MTLPLQSYCGPPPDPAELLWRWNFDPALAAALVAAALGYGWARRERWRGGANPWAFGGALAVLAVAFISPLCALSTALFSARVAHHLLIVGLAAPLLALTPSRPTRAPLWPATALQAAAMWFWHAPAPYAWALSGAAPYWIMEISLLGASVVFWTAVRGRLWDAPTAAALLVSMVLTGLLGALLTFAPSALFAPHFASTWTWGLTPLADQQLAGVIMWAPGALPYLIGALVVVALQLGPEPRHARP